MKVTTGTIHLKDAMRSSDALGMLVVEAFANLGTHNGGDSCDPTEGASNIVTLGRPNLAS